MSLSKLQELVMDGKAWHAAAHGVGKSRTRLNWITSYPLGWLLFKSKHKTMENNKYQILARMWKSWNFCALLVGIYNDAITVENSLRVPHKIKDRIAIWSSNSTLKCIPERTESKDSNRSLYTSVHSSIIHRNQKVSTIQMFINRWMGKQNVVNACNYSAMEGNGIVTIFYNMGEAWRHHAKWDKPGTRGQIWNTVYLYLFQVPKRVKFMEKEHRIEVTRFWRENGMEGII